MLINTLIHLNNLFENIQIGQECIQRDESWFQTLFFLCVFFSLFLLVFYLFDVTLTSVSGSLGVRTLHHSSPLYFIGSRLEVIRVTVGLQACADHRLYDTSRYSSRNIATFCRQREVRDVWSNIYQIVFIIRRLIKEITWHEGQNTRDALKAKW